MFKKIWFVLLLSACALPSQDGVQLKVDALVGTVPQHKTAVIKLENKAIPAHSLEYKQFYEKLEPLLEDKGYIIVDKSKPHDVVLNLYIGVNKYDSVRTRTKIEGGAYKYPESDEYAQTLTGAYYRTLIFAKVLKMTAVDAKFPKNELWKIKVVKEDSAEDFRSAQDQLLYLFYQYAEKDSDKQINGTLLNSEFYQRFVRKISPSESQPYFYAPMERKYDYERRLQARINANSDKFKVCGLTEKHEVLFEVSEFGTFSTFYPVKSSVLPQETLPDNVRACLAEVLEPLLEPPHGIPADEMMMVKLPFE